MLDDADKRRCIKDTLISIGKDVNMPRGRLLFSRSVLISQESTRKPVNNPIEAVIDNQELLNEVQIHLARGGCIVCEMVAVILPSKFTLESNYIIIDVERWAFPDVSFQNNRPYWLAGFINTSVIDNFKQIQADDIYHAISFSSGEKDPGEVTSMAVTEVYDIKNFTLAMRDATTLKLLPFSDGKYPMYHLEFKFYPRR